MRIVLSKQIEQDDTIRVALTVTKVTINILEENTDVETLHCDNRRFQVKGLSNNVKSAYLAFLSALEADVDGEYTDEKVSKKYAAEVAAEAAIANEV